MGGRIQSLELFHIDVPLPTPLFPVWIPGYPQQEYCYTLLRVTTRDGLVGHATCPAIDRERATLGDFMGRFLIGLDPYDLDAVHERLRQASFSGWRNSWMDIAFWDLAAQYRGIPLHALLFERLGAAPDTSPPVPESVRAYASFVELRPPRVRAESIERARAVGFLGAKLPVHAAAEEDDHVQLVAAREAAGPDFELMVHAHQAWSISLVEEVPAWDLDRARRFIDAAAGTGMRWVQEPLHDDAWSELAALARTSPVDIAGGDLSSTFVPIRALARDRCYHFLTPDAAFAGLGNVVRTLRACHVSGLGFSPSSKGDGIGLAANLHALVAWLRYTGDVHADRLEVTWEPPALVSAYRDAILDTPFEVDSTGRLPVPNTPGLGISVSDRALRRFADRFYRQTPLQFVSKGRPRPSREPTADSPTPRRRRTR